MYTFWCNTHAHCVSGCVRLLVLVLSKSCAIIMFDVWHSVGSMQCHPGWIGKGICKYLTESYFLYIHLFCHTLLVYHFIVSLVLLWQRMAVNLHEAHKNTDSRAAHEVLLVCYVLNIMQHTKYGLRAVHEI